jgi:hypothetical protein
MRQRIEKAGEALRGYQDDDLRCKLDVALRALD